MSPTLSRWTSVACGVAAASALALSTQLPWWSFAEVEVFLTRARHCFDQQCQAASMNWIGASLWWHRLSTAAFGVALLGAFLSVFVAGARAAGRVPRTAAGSLLVAVVTGTACGAATILMFPKFGDMRTGPGSLLYVVGLILAATGAGLARRAKLATPASSEAGVAQPLAVAPTAEKAATSVAAVAVAPTSSAAMAPTSSAAPTGSVPGLADNELSDGSAAAAAAEGAATLGSSSAAASVAPLENASAEAAPAEAAPAEALPLPATAGVTAVQADGVSPDEPAAASVSPSPTSAETP